MNAENVFLGVPLYNNEIDFRVVKVIYTMCSRHHNVVLSFHQQSLLAKNFNSLYAAALNAGKFKWFAMLHGDIIPEPFWLDKLIQIAEMSKADVLSAIVPIKTPDGLTSTAIQTSKESLPLECTRLTLSQLNDPHCPKIFDLDTIVKAMRTFDEKLQVPLVGAKRLLVNTGCMIVRLSEPARRLYFTIEDKIDFKNGLFIPITLSEDWNFSIKAADVGLRVLATTLVELTHIGNSFYSNNQVWGRLTDDL